MNLKFTVRNVYKLSGTFRLDVTFFLSKAWPGTIQIGNQVKNSDENPIQAVLVDLLV